MRDHKIDILRFIGLAMIILAHVNPPNLIHQIRNFDVPLMVLVSGISFGLSYKPTDVFSLYIWKRLKRLVFPVWIFLTLYFTSLYLVSPDSSALKLSNIFQSYAFIGGIGYVWIIRVFLLVALVSPLIFYFNQKIKSDSQYLLILLGAFGIYELFRYGSLPYLGANPGRFLSLVTHYITSYSLVFALGLRFPKLKIKNLYLVMATSFIVLCISAVFLFLKTGQFIPIQKLKYPPSCYYFSYSIFVSTLLWMNRSRLERVVNQLAIKKLILFIAQNSLWVYLWHIGMIRLFKEVSWVQFNFIIRYVVIFGVSSLIVFAQVSLVNYVLEQHFLSNSFKKNLKILFTG